jgi:hypothetical protein
MSFADQIESWQAFFTTVAGLAATLAGLLFVGLGLNPRIMAPTGPAGMRVLAAQTFHHFLVLLIIALIALAPTETARPLAVTLLIVGVQGLVRVGLDLRQARGAHDPRWGMVQALARSVWPAAAYALCLWLGVDLWDDVPDALGSIVVVVLLLLVHVSINCWDLLAAIGAQTEGAFGTGCPGGGSSGATGGDTSMIRNRRPQHGAL